MAFLDGDRRLHKMVEAFAGEWNQYSGLPFAFNAAISTAAVRVSFTPGGSWSFVGTDCLGVKHGPTLNLGWVNSRTPEDEVRRVVLHEFGHALGLIHEHQSPAAGIPWDVEAVYRFYQGPPNYWTRDQVDVNLFKRYAATETNYSDFDLQSIMLYPIPADLTLGGFAVDWNDQLSAMDKSGIAQLYPQRSMKADNQQQYEAQNRQKEAYKLQFGCGCGRH